ncbi:TIGR03619 family F420-dependent LLM class oxidoreductase [Nocardioides marinquilinus]|uniref:TIGR03619 family F420-dependent LLM class oxidoreductase n=1 Tax=Nocardioides marinquilinus TaxID=1210400 RepID=A0ABP9PEB5_9ACTN
MARDLPEIGFGLPVSGSWATPPTMVHVARRAEALGYASLWTFQRTLTPAADGHHGGSPAFRSVHDALLPLALVAGHTERIRLGPATICAPLTPPAQLAKALTTLDHLCGGRLSAGLSIGWMAEEYAAAGVPFEGRGARMEEYLHCLTALLTDDPVAFEGEHYTVPPSHNALRPLQQPHPPVLLGGSVPAALRRAGRLAQGWIGGGNGAADDLERTVETVRDGAREAGRDPDAVRVLLRWVVELTDDDPGPDRSPGTGTAEQVLDDLAALRGRGATEVFVDLNFSRRVGSPDVDPAEALAHAERVLEALAPGQP